MKILKPLVDCHIEIDNNKDDEISITYPSNLDWRGFSERWDCIERWVSDYFTHGRLDVFAHAVNNRAHLPPRDCKKNWNKKVKTFNR
eukprot:UN17107